MLKNKYMAIGADKKVQLLVIRAMDGRINNIQLAYKGFREMLYTPLVISLPKAKCFKKCFTVSRYIAKPSASMMYPKIFLKVSLIKGILLSSGKKIPKAMLTKINGTVYLNILGPTPIGFNPAGEINLVFIN